MKHKSVIWSLVFLLVAATIPVSGIELEDGCEIDWTIAEAGTLEFLVNGNAGTHNAGFRLAGEVLTFSGALVYRYNFDGAADFDARVQQLSNHTLGTQKVTLISPLGTPIELEIDAPDFTRVIDTVAFTALAQDTISIPISTEIDDDAVAGEYSILLVFRATTP